MQRRLKRLLLLVIVLSSLAVSGCNQGFVEKPYKESHFLMDTLIEITAYGPQAEKGVKDAFGEFERMYALADQYDPGSQIAKVNQAAGSSRVAVDADIFAMVEEACQFADKLEGTFDVSVGPLVELWGIGKKGEFVPSDTEITEILPLVNYKLIELDKANQTIYLPKKGMKLDLGGVAKGYAVDKAIAKLQAAGIKSALINAGGTVRVLGTRPDGKPWRIGVQDPRNPDGVMAKLALTGWDTMETSGDYQRFIMKDNVRYAHLFDPRTGKQPREMAAVTMIMNNASQGDIFSTALFVLGVERSLAVLKNFPGVEAIFVTLDGKVITTPGLAGKVE